MGTLRLVAGPVRASTRTRQFSRGRLLDNTDCASAADDLLNAPTTLGMFPVPIARAIRQQAADRALRIPEKIFVVHASTLVRLVSQRWRKRDKGAPDQSYERAPPSSA